MSVQEINNASVLEALAAEFGELIINSDEPYGFLTIEIPAEKNTAIIQWLMEHPTIKMNFLTDLCGVHFPDNKGKEIGVVYHLHSWTNNFRMRIKCFVAAAAPEVPTLTTLFDAANWMERETFDFYGIQFVGHPDLRRILNMDEMDYHPLLKQYALEDETRDDKDDRFFGR